MKKLSILLLTMYCCPAFGQQKKTYNFDYNIIYQMSYQPDSNNKAGVQKEYMELLTNDSTSVFRAVKRGKLDSAIYSEFKKGNLMGPSDIAFITNNFSQITYVIVKEKQRQKTLTFDQIYITEPLYYDEDLEDLKWEIKNDTTTINGLACQRADLTFGHRKWIAWFAPEIPITDGPYKFAGLPGLIIKITDNQGYWSFDMLSLKNTKKEVALNFDKARLPVHIDKKLFFKQKRNYIDNAFEINEARGYTTPNAAARESLRKHFSERAKKNNNWIELYKAN